MRWGKCFWSFVDALGFLSIVPMVRQNPLEPEEFGRFPAWYPVVGFVFGIDLLITWWLASFVLPPTAAAVLVVAILVILNRGFHVDGLADAADGLLSHKSREQKLLIMKDSRQGTFGVLAIVFDMMIKVQFVAVAAPAAPWVLLLWPIWGRVAASVVAVKSQYIGSEGGLGRYMVEYSTTRELFFAALFSLLVSLIFGGAAVLTCLAAIFSGFILVQVWKKALNGITGDLLGATIELTEMFILLIFVILHQGVFNG